MSRMCLGVLLLLVLSLLSDISVGLAVETVSGDYYEYTPGSLFSYDEAVSKCQNLATKNIALSMPKTAADRDVIMTDSDLSLQSEKIWIGLSKRDDNKWHWLDNSLFDETQANIFWDTNEPINTQTGSVAYFDAAKGKALTSGANSQLRYIALCVAKNDAVPVPPVPVPTYDAAYSKCLNIDNVNGEWELFRHTPRGTHFFSGNDNLQGSILIGNVNVGSEYLNYNSKFEWSKKWVDKFASDEIEFLFATGDCNNWLIVHSKDIFFRAPYIKSEMYFIKSSVDNLGSCKTATVDADVNGSPRIGLHGMRYNTYARNGYLYMEDNYNFKGKQLVNSVGGVNVWIRSHAHYIPNGACTKAPTTSKPTTSPSKFSALYLKCLNIDGGDWQLVRHVPDGVKFFSGNDDLKGSLSIGNVAKESVHSYYDSTFEWSLKWENSPWPSSEIEFLFSTSQCDKWMVTHYRDIFNSEIIPYRKQNINIHRSSQNSNSVCTQATYDVNMAASPYIGLHGMRRGTYVSNGYLYIEDGYNWKKKRLVNSVGGINVWIRHRPNYQVKKC